MDGFFDNGGGGFGGGFDMLNPLRAAGIDPSQIDPRDQHAARMMMLTAMGNSLAGGTPFFDAVNSVADRADARQMKQLQQLQLLTKIQQQRQLMGIQGNAAALFAQQPGAAQPAAPAGGAPAAAGAAAPADPTSGATPAPGSMQPVDPRKTYAEMYRRAARLYAPVDSETSKRFEDIANQYDPPETYGTEPRMMVGPDGKLGEYLVGQHGTLKALQGVAPPPKLSAPTAGQNGMFTMDENSGKTMPLTGPDGAPIMPHVAPAAALQEYQLARQQGYTGTINDFLIAKAKAGAASMSVKVGNTLGQDVAAGIAKDIMATKTQAMAATDQLQNIAQIRQALSDGAITGPLAGARIMGARVLSMVGVHPEIQKKLAATAAAVQAMSRSNVTAAQALNGQGQISDGERALIADSANGKREMTGAELMAVTEANEKVARMTLQGYQRQVQAASQIKGMEVLKPFYEATMPGGSIDEASKGAPGAPASKVDAGGTPLAPRGKVPSFNGPVSRPSAPPPAATAKLPAGDLAAQARAELERRRKLQGAR